MNRFFVEAGNITGEYVYIDGPEVNHIKNVLRLKPGEEVSVYNGTDSREYRCHIESIGDKQVVCRLRFIKEANVELPCRITVFQGLPKGDKLDIVVQKAVELGAAEIIPVTMQRSVVKLDEKKTAKREERLREIARAAAQQSGRAIIPDIRFMSMKEACSYAAGMDMCIVPYELAMEKADRGMEYTRQIVDSIMPGMTVGIFVGPEGGFAEEEVNGLEALDATIITMGRRILRTETAAMTVLSWILLRLEDREFV